MLNPLNATALRDEHSGRDETCDLLLPIAELGQNLGAVYTKTRGARRTLPGVLDIFTGMTAPSYPSKSIFI
jgi:hypothetical protein